MGQTGAGHWTDSQTCAGRERVMNRGPDRKKWQDFLDEEIREYIEHETDENIARGMSPEAARRAAPRSRIAEVRQRYKGKGRCAGRLDHALAGAVASRCWIWLAHAATESGVQTCRSEE